MKIETAELGSELSNYDYARRPKKAADRQPGSVPYLGASGVVDFVEGYTHSGDFLCVSEDGENLRSRKTPIAWVQRGKFWANNHLHVLGGVSLSRLRFFAAALNYRSISAYLTGSAQPKLSQDSLHSIAVPKFSPEAQTAIGEVLGALDDKIAANTRLQNLTIELAGTVAARSTKRLPLHAIANIDRNTISPKQMAPHLVAHYSLPAFDRGGWSLESGASIKSSKYLIEEPVLLVSKLNPRFPRIWPIDRVPDALAVSSTEFVPLVPKDPLQVSDLWAATLDPNFSRQLEALVTGTTGSHQRIRPDDLLHTSVLDTRDLDDGERNLLGSLCEKATAIVQESQTLASVRDELLLQLMSGRITVRDAEKTVEEVV